MKSAVPNALEVEKIALGSLSDTAIQAAVDCYHTDHWHTIKESHGSSWIVRDELTVTESLLIEGPHIVIPQTLQAKVVELTHTDHQGISKTKTLLRS